ncbi:TIR domain-containing protein [Mucilaginibacter celer]|uniref:TIR domain-containing protein n=1 Tax=Mucilaginibacter celer TaxID=2305508 RepID=A0A494W1D9_9SPHI|nr:TIR domain-containing protein [Mucilaginibacter celer]AYL97325.1 TIR domain-containing protein [Mucilaginibacter celer]
MKPTADKPLLVGILVDVSGSMMSAIENKSGNTISRLESFRDALEDLVKKASILSRANSSERIAPLINIFSYGFGFGGILSAFFGSKGPKVRDLLDTPFTSNTTVAIDQLANNWRDYKNHLEKLAREMLGDTPMKEGFQAVFSRFEFELRNKSYAEGPVLFVLSDGDPTDSAYHDRSDIISIAEKIKRLGVTIISCYVTDHNITESRKLYSNHRSDWPSGANLMLKCASTISPGSPFANYLREYGWNFEPNARLFNQVNQSELLSEFMQMVLSPLNDKTTPVKASSKTKVFISYSHQDSSYFNKGSLIDYLSGLEREGFEFWYDKKILAGDDWDDEIKQQIEKADIVLTLVSQYFLNSKYCSNTEVQLFLQNQRSRGLIIFPVILSPCDWKSHDWLTRTQFEPREGMSIEVDFINKGQREQLYLTILQQLRKLAHRNNFD